MTSIIKILAGQPQIIEDKWVTVRTPNESNASHPGSQIVPFSRWKESQETDGANQARGVWISPDDDFEPFADRLPRLDIIAVDFPSFRDGRGYSISYLLRTRYGWTKELRAIGDVLRDQLNYMRRCGFDAFAVRPDKDIHNAIKSFGHYSVQYQGAVDEPLPLFRRRPEA